MLLAPLVPAREGAGLGRARHRGRHRCGPGGQWPVSSDRWADAALITVIHFAPSKGASDASSLRRPRMRNGRSGGCVHRPGPGSGQPLPLAPAESLITEALTIEGPLINNLSLPQLR